MIIFSKKDVIPIIVPQLYFQDKYNNTNNYVEMNPSLFIEEDGTTTILVRCVNYKKFDNKQYILYQSNSNSIYYILKGSIQGKKKLNIENFEYKILEQEYNLHRFPTYWFGLEDIRFIDSNTMLVNVPELHESGKPSIFKAELNENKITNFTECKPNTNAEKNWMPYFDINSNKVIYSLNPFLIKSIEKNDILEINIPEEIKNKLTGFHGSTNGIIISKYERLFLIHINREKTYNIWLILNIKTNEIQLSDEFLFFKNTYIEFACSLSRLNDRIFISLGVNDDKAFIIETCMEDINNIIPKNFFFKNEQKYPTIVTMLYDIRSMETTQIERNRKLDSYIDFSKHFLLLLPFPIIFFIDENEETYDAIYNSRKELDLLDKTFIYMCDFTTTYFYKDFTRLQNLQTQFHIINGEISHETPLYVILNNNKFDCIDKTIELNPFNSSHLIWIDFGINHVAESTEYIYKWINKVPDKIKQMCINPFIENVDTKQHFRFIYHNMAGGLFSGSIENMKKYSELFKNKTEEIYNNNWYQIDEAVMTIVHRENEELFDLFYGDYRGIISNYLSPIHNIDLIIRNCQKMLDYNKVKSAYDILYYCLPYFENNPNSELMFYFIQLNIITNYYNNNKNLLEKIVDLINLKKKSVIKYDKEKIYNLLEQNKVNIEYYENKHLISN
jgi:hypothetical protein